MADEMKTDTAKSDKPLMNVREIVLALIVAGAVGTIALIGPIIQQAYTDTHTALSGS